MRQVVHILLFFILHSFATYLIGDEPRVREQPLDELIKQLQDKNPEKVCAAASALGKRGQAKDAVPTLKDLLKNRNSRIKLAAAEALWRLEHKAADLVPVYAELLTASDSDVRAASAWRLGRLGSDARPAVLMLAATLRDEDYEVRVQVGQALANLGAFAEPALPALVRALSDEQLDEPRQGNQERKWENARRSPALPALVELSEDAIPLLMETVRSSAIKRRADDSSGTHGREIAPRVATAFPAFGAKALTPLLQAMETKNEETRAFAVFALSEMAQLNGLPENAVEKLEKCLGDSNKEIRDMAARAVSFVRPSSAKAVATLAKTGEDSLLGHKDLLPDLERMSPHNEAARKLLLRLLDDKHTETAQEAHRVFAKLDLPHDQQLKVWTRALSHSDSKVRSEALFGLKKLGPLARSTKSALYERFTKEPDYYNKGSIFLALAHIDPNDPALTTLLIKSLNDPESWVRWSALGTLEELGPKAKDALPRITDRLLSPHKEGKENVRDSSEFNRLVTTLVRIDPGSAATATTLLKALQNQDVRSVHCPKNTWFMRDILEDHLQAILPAAAPVLREALKDKDDVVRKSAALILVQAGRDIETALPVLMDNLWSGKDDYSDLSRFQWRVVKRLSHRQLPITQAVAKALCEGWRTAHPKVRETLERGLLALQPEALPHLLDQLQQAKATQARRDLAHLLAHFEGQGKQVMPILREELRETQPTNQYAAAKALMQLGPDIAEAVPELVRLLRSPNPGMRAVAAQALARIGRPARPAVTVLKVMLQEDKPEMLMIAADTLSQIDPDGNEPLAFLRDELMRKVKEGRSYHEAIKLPDGLEDHYVYSASVGEIIARYGERAVPILTEILDNVDLDEWSPDNVSTQCGSPARVQAALLLAQLGPEAIASVPALTRTLKDRDPFIRESAASALGRVGPTARKAAPDVISLLEQQNRLTSAAGAWSSSPQRSGRSSATNGYGYGGAFSFRSLGREKHLSRDSDFGLGYGDHDPYWSVRPTYPYDPAYVLSRIDGETRSAQPILSEMARDANHPGRLSAALALWRSGGDSSDLLPAFSVALEAHGRSKEKGVPLTLELRECLTELDTQLKPAIPALCDWLKQEHWPVTLKDQALVIDALGRLGPDAREKADLLRPLIHGGEWNARRRVAAAQALFRILGDKDLAFPVLREVLFGNEERGSIYYQPDMTDTARVRAARALGVLADSGDERAAALLVETAKGDENMYVRLAALEATARQKKRNEAAVKSLCAMLCHPDATVRFEVVSACGRLGQHAKGVLKDLRVAAEDSHLIVRQTAKQALETLDP